jgi:hypothetical protein
MSKNKPLQTIDLAYMGQRLHNNKLADYFVSPDDLDGDPSAFQVGRKARHLVIGWVYTIPVTHDGLFTLSDAKAVEGLDVEELVSQGWSAADNAARRAKGNESARDKLIKTHRDAWREGMSALRDEYRYMTNPQRRAMRQLVIEWLEESF